MTTLALLQLNPESRLARRCLNDPQSLHKTLMSCFAEHVGEAARSKFELLWRIEPSDAPTILMQSEPEPDFSALPSDFASVRSRSLDGHIERLRVDQIVDFRVVLNPVRKSRTGNVNKQMVVPSRERSTWAADRLKTAGLEPLSPPTLTGMPDRHIKRAGKRVPIYAVRLDGIATVTDAAALRGAMRRGIGHAKSWGCGLLTVLGA